MNYIQNQDFSAPTLFGDDLYLRPCKLSDFDSLKIYRQDPENCRYIRPPETDEQLLELVEQFSQPWVLSEGRWNGWVICLMDNTVVGEIVFNIESWEHQRAEIGYRMNNQFTGKGICTLAANMLVNFLFTHIGIYKIVAKCDPRNIASTRVMEKLGMQREAEFKRHYLIGTEWTDQHDYGLLCLQWKQCR